MILHQAAGAIHRANIHEEELRELKQRVDVDSGFEGIVGKDPKMQVIFKLTGDWYARRRRLYRRCTFFRGVRCGGAAENLHRAKDGGGAGRVLFGMAGRCD